MDIGLNRQAKMTTTRLMALVFSVGLLAGVIIGYSIGGRGWVTVIDPNCDPDDPDTVACEMIVLETDIQ